MPYIQSAIARYLARTEAQISRTMSDRDFYLITIPLACIAGAAAAALSFVVSVPPIPGMS
jgi:hypothetical protein